MALLTGCRGEGSASKSSSSTTSSGQGAAVSISGPTTSGITEPLATVTLAPTQVRLESTEAQPVPDTPVLPQGTIPLPQATANPSSTPQDAGPALDPMPTLPTIEVGLIRHGDRTQPRVALTFDACQTAQAPAGYDAAIIRILTETQTAATLFLGGLWMQSHPTQTQLLANVPFFELGNHSWSHLDFATIPEGRALAEITATQEIMYELVGRQPRLFRFPFGTFSDESLRIVARHGLKPIQWDVVTGDPDPNITAEDMVRAVKNNTKNGSIIIMHMNTRGWHTAEALPTIISELDQRGFEFVTVSQLLAEPDHQAEVNAVVTGTTVNLRQGPGTDREIVGTVHAGDRIAVLCSIAGQMVSRYGTNVWYRIEHNGGEAYVHSALVALDGTVAPCD
jgi:peptidoglycan/xylan/chitin deacetylase (PgdA/CDA1 family)